MTQTLRFMFLGDIVGPCGCELFQKWCPKLKEKYKIDAVIINGENSAKNGKGLLPKNMEFFKHNGASVVTSGNHVWQHKEIYSYLNSNTDLIRPANFPSACPGKGYTIFQVNGIDVAVVNLQGRIFMRENLDCPFRTAESLLIFLHTKAKIIFVDFHAEATSEKQALAAFLNGKVSGVFGTHTHVQTADEKILSEGTSYISDLGFCGSAASVLGVEKPAVIQMFLTQMMHRFVVASAPPFAVNGIWIEVDVATGKTLKIERINILEEQLVDNNA